tara:strand:+ start:2669 stop:3076 length:408 start_codon:yes stop_codon:yes gene_type:complete
MSLILSSPTYAAKELIEGPLHAEVLSVYDGDTIKVRIHVWLGLYKRISIRVRGIDTPEIRGKCQEEKEKAILVRELVKQLVENRVVLTHIIRGKFAGRAVANVWTKRNESIATILIGTKHARSFDGKSKREGWCP